MWETKQAPGEAVLLALTVEAANVRPSTPSFYTVGSWNCKIQHFDCFEGAPPSLSSCGML
jgi:hypothetical protein